MPKTKLLKDQIFSKYLMVTMTSFIATQVIMFKIQRPIASPDAHDAWMKKHGDANGLYYHIVSLIELNLTWA